MVVGILGRQGVSQEDWEQSLRTGYRVYPLLPREWSVCPPPGTHLSTMEGVPVREWRPEPNVTSDELLRRLTQLEKGTSQACSNHSQESYFRHSQQAKEDMRDYEPEQGRQYHEGPVDVDSEIAGYIIATVTHLHWELQTAKDGWQVANDHAFDAKVQQRQAEREVAEL